MGQEHARQETVTQRGDRYELAAVRALEEGFDPATFSLDQRLQYGIGLAILALVARVEDLTDTYAVNQ